MRIKSFFNLIISIFIVFSFRLIVTLSMGPSSFDWYYGLNLPSTVPEDWVFGYVWTAIYSLMAGAIFNILNLYQLSEIKSLVALYFTHMAFHATWGFLFFLLKSPFLGLLDISLSLFTLFLLVCYTARFSKLSAVLLLPYLAWLSYATLIAAQIYQLN